jgi:Leucine rich repeat
MPSANEKGLAEAERRIAEAKRAGEIELNLSDLDLKVLPESVCRLAHLRFLYANNNRLAQLPESMGRLLRLRELSLLGNRLTQLPRCLGLLARLESLRLSHNRLTQLPEWIGQLGQLKKLHLNSNQLVRLPESIGQLVQLEELYLHRNQLVQLPQSACQLVQLRKLYLYGNEALDIPAEELGPTRREIREKRGSLRPPREVLDSYFCARVTSRSERGKDKMFEINITPRQPKLRSEEIDVKAICFVVVYFGKWPIWFPAFLHSCKTNFTINWIVFTDCDLPTHHPSNVAFHYKTLWQMRQLIKDKLGKEATLTNAYKICDYKPAFGIIFEEYLRNFAFWGHCDIDIIWGNVRRYVTEKILDNYDIVSTRKGMVSGHCSIFRNKLSINRIFMRSAEFGEVMRQAECCAFDEEGMTRLVARLARAGSIRVYWPKFLQNYADPKTDCPSTLPRYVNRYVWKKGKLLDCTGETPAEILYLHFMTWKKTLIECEYDYGTDLDEFYISYCKISINRIS